MAETIRRGTEIRDFQPDDTETEFYLDSNYRSYTLQEILERAREKWGPELNFEQLTIQPKHIHTECLGFDRYDPGDYTDFLLISYTPA